MKGTLIRPAFDLWGRDLSHGKLSRYRLNGKDLMNSADLISVSTEHASAALDLGTLARPLQVYQLTSPDYRRVSF